MGVGTLVLVVCSVVCGEPYIYVNKEEGRRSLIGDFEIRHKQAVGKEGAGEGGRSKARGW